jgi:hypothetical protein
MLANNEKFEDLQGTFVSWTDIHQEMMEAAIHCMRAWQKEMTA